MTFRDPGGGAGAAAPGCSVDAQPKYPIAASYPARRGPGGGESRSLRCQQGFAEEAEVVVVKPVVQNRYGQVAPPEAGPVRRLLKALRGGSADLGRCRCTAENIRNRR